MRARRVSFVVLIALAAVACKKRSPDPDPNATGDPDTTALAEDGTDSNMAEVDAETLTSTLIGGGGSGGTIGLADFSGGDLSASTIGDGAKAIYFPRSCLTVDATSNPVKYTFTGCNGPNGLLNVTGVVDATYAVTASTLTLDLVATDLQVNRATIDWSAHAVVVADGTNRTMTWHAQISGTTARGRDLARTNDKTVKWTIGEPCLAIEGVSQGNVSGRELKTEITAFRRCRGSCPDAGGKIVITNVARAKSIEIDYDGTNQATLIGPNGATTKFPLLCR